MKELSYYYLEQKIDYSQYPEELKKVRRELLDTYTQLRHLKEDKSLEAGVDGEVKFEQYILETSFLGIRQVMDYFDPKALMVFLGQRAKTSVKLVVDKQANSFEFIFNPNNSDKRQLYQDILEALACLLRWVFIAIRLGKDKDHAREVAVELATYNGYKE